MCIAYFTFRYLRVGQKLFLPNLFCFVNSEKIVIATRKFPLGGVGGRVFCSNSLLFVIAFLALVNCVRRKRFYPLSIYRFYLICKTEFVFKHTNPLNVVSDQSKNSAFTHKSRIYSLVYNWCWLRKYFDDLPTRCFSVLISFSCFIATFWFPLYTHFPSCILENSHRL